jgi:hypothetical protein
VVESNQARSGTLSGSHLLTGVRRAALLAGVFVVVQTGVADAQFWPYYQYRYEYQGGREDFRRPREDVRSRDESRPRKSNRNSSTAKKKDTPIRHPFGENMPKGPLQLVVSIGDQRATLYSNGMRVADAKVSTGVAGHPTPTGVFSIIQKNRWHRSNLYSNAPMYYMHRLTWSGIALHEGHLADRFRLAALEREQARHARGGHARRRAAARDFARQAVQSGAEAGRHLSRR